MRAWGPRILVSLSQVNHSQQRFFVLCCLELIRPLEYLLGHTLGDLRAVPGRDYEETQDSDQALGLHICGASGNHSACTRQMQ